MIPRPPEKEVLAEIRAHEPYCGEKKEKWLLAFLKNCEYIGDGKYVVTALNLSFGKHDTRRFIPTVLACPYDPSSVPN